MSYESTNLLKPSVFEGAAKNEKVLIIGSGHSTKEIVNKKDKIRGHFDKIIVCNYAFEKFDDIADYHMVTEKTSKTSTNDVFKKLSDGNFDTNTPRIVNWKGISMYPNRYNLVKTTRSDFGGFPDVRKYRHKGYEGLLIGPKGSQGFALGSILLCAMHFSAILGASSVYIIGGDMCFKNEFDHFYDDSVYRKPPSKVKKANAHKIVSVELDKKIFETTLFFKESAEFLDKSINSIFSDIEVVDFSNGLLTAPTKLNICDIIGDKEI